MSKSFTSHPGGIIMDNGRASRALGGSTHRSARCPHMFFACGGVRRRTTISTSGFAENVPIGLCLHRGGILIALARECIVCVNRSYPAAIATAIAADIEQWRVGRVCSECTRRSVHDPPCSSRASSSAITHRYRRLVHRMACRAASLPPQLCRHRHTHPRNPQHRRHQHRNHRHRYRRRHHRRA